VAIFDGLQCVSAEEDEASGWTAAPCCTQPSAVHEVEYDEHGQTWDVYGAEFDPEILGQAIQAHLQRIMTVHSIHDRHGTAAAAEHCELQASGSDRAVTSPHDVSQPRAPPARQKRDVIGRFFQRYTPARTETPAVRSNSWSALVDRNSLANVRETTAAV